jgi:hypothetical protein
MHTQIESDKLSVPPERKIRRARIEQQEDKREINTAMHSATASDYLESEEN